MSIHIKLILFVEEEFNDDDVLDLVHERIEYGLIIILQDLVRKRDQRRNFFQVCGQLSSFSIFELLFELAQGLLST